MRSRIESRDSTGLSMNSIASMNGAMVAIHPVPLPAPVVADADELSDLTSTLPLPAPTFVDRLQVYALRSRAVEHPLLAAIADGDFADLRGAIRRLLGEYYVYSHRFTRYL